MTNDKIKAALEALDETWYNKEDDQYCYLTDDQIETIRQCLQSCLWNYNMEEAPRDGTHVLIWWPEEYHAPMMAYYDNRYCFAWRTKSFIFQHGKEPTAWKHINPPGDLG